MERILQGFLDLERVSVLNQFEIKAVVETVLNEIRTKRNLLSEILNFDVLSLNLSAQLFEGTDNNDLREAAQEMLSYFNEVQCLIHTFSLRTDLKKAFTITGIHVNYLDKMHRIRYPPAYVSSLFIPLISSQDRYFQLLNIKKDTLSCMAKQAWVSPLRLL